MNRTVPEAEPENRAAPEIEALNRAVPEVEPENRTTPESEPMTAPRGLIQREKAAEMLMDLLAGVNALTAEAWLWADYITKGK